MVNAIEEMSARQIETTAGNLLNFRIDPSPSETCPKSWGALPGSGHFQFFPVLGRKPDVYALVFRLCHLFLRQLHPFL